MLFRMQRADTLALGSHSCPEIILRYSRQQALQKIVARQAPCLTEHLPVKAL